MEKTTIAESKQIKVKKRTWILLNNIRIDNFKKDSKWETFDDTISRILEKCKR